MKTDEHIEERTEETQVSHEAMGTVSLVPGVAAVAMYGSPFLYFLPSLIWFPRTSTTRAAQPHPRVLRTDEEDPDSVGTVVVVGAVVSGIRERYAGGGAGGWARPPGKE
ncbi:hypothetical protein [Streptomyces lydicus]|uniref:hypothetical protein n=1 Tax=Streptomyces lydicus TaxID=47763 RepID=UPI001012FC10|nr:hypothetical protein [Streptomyces lydicus]MCZ1011810.1 hypothetical protein [Streptomyces lydicus]